MTGSHQTLKMKCRVYLWPGKVDFCFALTPILCWSGFLLEIYFQLVNSKIIGRYETPSPNTTVEMLSGKPG